jgi:hypothetical protein
VATLREDERGQGGDDMTVPDYSSGPPALPSSTPRSNVGRAPKAMVWIGGVMTVVGIGAFILGFVVMGAKMFETFDEGLDPASALDLTVDVPGEGRVFLEPDRYQVVALGPRLTGVSGMHSDAGGQTVHRLPFPDPAATVTGPDGQEVAFSSPGIERLVHAPGLDSVGLWEFTVPEAGEYTLEVGGESGAVTAVGIGEAEGLWDEAKGWVAAAIISSVGGLLAALGTMLLVVGIVWWVVARSTRAAPAAPA